MANPRREKIKAELLALQDKHQRITPDQVWKWAKENKKSELSKLFPWNVQKAAESCWRDIARDAIVTYLTVQITTRHKIYSTVGYVRNPQMPSNQQGMIALTSDLIRQQDAQKIMMNEVDRCEAAVTRARDVVSVLAAKHPRLPEQLEGLLEGLLIIRQELQAA